MDHRRRSSSWTFLCFFLLLGVLIATTRTSAAVNAFSYPRLTTSTPFLLARIPSRQKKQPEIGNRCCSSGSGSGNMMLLMLRGGGGGGGGVSGSSSSIRPPTLVGQAASIFLALNSISLFVAPNAILKNVYRIKQPDDESSCLARDYAQTIMRAIASVGLCTAILVFLSTVVWTVQEQGTRQQAMIGWALAPRVVYFWSLLFSNRLSKLGMKKFAFIFNTVLSTACMLSQFSVLGGNPKGSARIFSCLAIFKGLLFVLAPAWASNRLLGINVTKSEMSQCRALLRGLGNEMLTSAVMLALVAFEATSAVTAACIVSGLWGILLFDMAFIDKTWRLMDASGGPQAQVVHLAVALLLTAGFYLSGRR